MNNRILWTVLAIAFSLPATSCVTSGTMDRVEGAAADLVLPPQQEKQLGKRMEAEIGKEMRALPLREVQRYVEQVGARVAKPTRRQREVDVTFTVLDKPDEINAFAIPGGHIYVYSGLILAARDESELAGVLAHEVGHVAERHIARQMAKSMGLQVVASLALGENPGTLARLAAGVAGQGFLLRYSRQDEFEADHVAVKYLIESGYSPTGFLNFFQELRRQQGRDPSTVEVLFMTHPSSADRQKRVQEAIETYAPRGYRGTTDSRSFGRIQKAIRNYQQRSRGQKPRVQTVGDLSR